MRTAKYSRGVAALTTLLLAGNACQRSFHCGAPEYRDIECTLIKAIDIQTEPLFKQVEQYGLRERFYPDSVHFQWKESSVVPGLSFVTATYVPPGWSDVLLVAYGLVAGDSAWEFKNAKDWERAITTWSPRDSSGAVTACEEGAMLLAEPDPRRPPILFREGVSVQDSFWVVVRDSADLRQLTFPRASRGPSGVWTTDLWLLTFDSSDHFRCRLQRPPGVHAAIEVVGKLSGVGLSPYGP